MKKIHVVLIVVLCLCLFVCVSVFLGLPLKFYNRHVENPEVIENNENMENYYFDYEGELVVQGVGPEISFESTVEEGTLVLRAGFEYHNDHVFLNQGIRENFFESENEYLPGNTVKFIGKVEALDAAAGNHYYDVKSVEELQVIAYPDVDEVKDLLESYNYCEETSDCTYIMGECPFGCFVAYDKKFEDIPERIMNNYFELNGKSCVYGCMYRNTVKCENYKCVMANDENEDGLEMHDEDEKDEIIFEGDEGLIVDNGECCSCCPDLQPGESCIALCCPCAD